jgi:ribosomal protein S19E (S16A)
VILRGEVGLGMVAGLNPGIGGNVLTGGARSVKVGNATSEIGEEILAAFANAGVVASTKPLKGAISQDFIVNCPFEC